MKIRFASLVLLFFGAILWGSARNLKGTALQSTTNKTEEHKNAAVTQVNTQALRHVNATTTQPRLRCSSLGYSPKVTVVARAINNIDVFAVSDINGGVYTSAWDPKGGWKGWWRIGNLKASPGSRVAAVSRGPNKLNIFVADYKGYVHTAAWDGEEGSGWRGWWTLGNSYDSKTVPGGSVTAIARAPDELDVFVAGKDTNVWAKRWTGNTGWSAGWERVGKAGAMKVVPGSPIAVVSTNANNLSLFLADATGRIKYTRVNGEAWGKANWRNIQNGHTSPGGSVTATLNGPYHIDLFVVGSSGGVFTASLAKMVPTPGKPDAWKGWDRIGTLKAKPGSLVAATSTSTNRVHIFVFDDNYYIQYAKQENGKWTPWGKLFASNIGKAQGEMVVVSRARGILDWFLAEKDLKIPVWTAAKHQNTWKGPWNLSGGSRPLLFGSLSDRECSSKTWCENTDEGEICHTENP